MWGPPPPPMPFPPPDPGPGGVQGEPFTSQPAPAPAPTPQSWASAQESPQRGPRWGLIALLALIGIGVAVTVGLLVRSGSSSDNSVGSVVATTTTAAPVVAAPGLQDAGEAGAQVCITERASIIEAFKASNLSSLPGSEPAKYSDFLPVPPKYFAIPDGPTTGRIQRAPGTLRLVPISRCPPIFPAEVPVGSR